jgi:hypothetical protein
LCNPKINDLKKVFADQVANLPEKQKMAGLGILGLKVENDMQKVLDGMQKIDSKMDIQFKVIVWTGDCICPHSPLAYHPQIHRVAPGLLFCFFLSWFFGTKTHVKIGVSD